ncbi:MAG: flagellar motor protein MotA [Ignavibacteriae bacterium HGW-Ignavibacteriae-4]|nr:MAG: flagellar motor protein MotA [Ignavibacteriae bacterium HGW-Ignavibacteriae-4]
MKNLFNIIVIVLSLVVSAIFYEFIMGNPDGFVDLLRHEPKPGNMLATIYTGGPLVALLMSFILIGITFSIERFLSITKAQGKNNPETFVKELSGLLSQGNIEGAIALCDSQRGSIGNVMRAGIERFKEVQSDPEYSAPAKISEVQRAIDEQMNLETPLLEKNLVILSTVASISTMVGLLGTTLGMIKAFQALAESGTVSATQLSIGISEALYNTAGGLFGAIIAIVAYNFFTTKVDNFVYVIDEGILSVTEIFTSMVRK